MKNEKDENRKIRRLPVTAATLDDGTRLELLYDASEERTAFAVWDGTAWRKEAFYELGNGERLVPYSARNNLIKRRVVLLPSAPAEYESEEALLDDIQSFIHRYVDVSAAFERIASHYVLFTWVYDRFNEVPYLRLRGDYGSGKTRFLLTIGALCYKPIFASGASTVSPLFHTLDAFRGTLIIDEADFRFSDAKADVVKILNNGTVRGLPVLRTEMNRYQEFSPRAYEVFGPKIVASRGHYHDDALESRFITEEMGTRKLRGDIPLNLSSRYRDEALALRNKLLLYRFRTFDRPSQTGAVIDRSIEPRLNQVFSPLLSIVERKEVRTELRALAKQYHRTMVSDRGMEIEAQVLQVIRHLSSGARHPYIPIRDIAATFTEHFGKDYERQVTNKWIGAIVRRKLNLATRKSQGIYVVPLTERPKLAHLYERYGIESDGIEDNASLTEELKLVFDD